MLTCPTLMHPSNFRRVGAPGWLSPQSTGLLISGSLVRAPHWVQRLLTKKFPEGYAPHGHPFKRPHFRRSLADHVARPLATAHESVKSQTYRLLSLFNSSITASKRACNRTTELIGFLTYSEWWPSKQEAFHSQRTTIHDPSSSLSVS